ncbi:hypothetical protein LIER_37035 [Lithospermum erythrorhizon]|uniref:Reverse transcriptase domain-containing protein n=1 Tax=Lithospermum erythrorhizon TaxID=34254 RepID=A0AAV3PFT1_LITER
MSDYKSPGLDGFPAEFYKKKLGYCQEGCYSLKFLNSGHLLKEINNTFITLIPKFDNPSNMVDYRPISLCNAIYKIASKVLVNRLKPFMNSLVSPFQNGFVHGRGIQDNIIMAQELTHIIRTSKCKKIGLVVIKIDMSKAKAFDRIKWDFLFKLLKTTGFSGYWVKLIKECLPLSCTRLLLMDKFWKPSSLSYGLRQGAPLSPILFALCTEALSSSLQFHQDQGNLKGIGLARNGPKLFHLLFVDDSYFFMHLDNKSLDSFCSSLNFFCADSG